MNQAQALLSGSSEDLSSDENMMITLDQMESISGRQVNISDENCHVKSEQGRGRKRK